MFRNFTLKNLNWRFSAHWWRHWRHITHSSSSLVMIQVFQGSEWRSPVPQVSWARRVHSAQTQNTSWTHQWSPAGPTPETAYTHLSEPWNPPETPPLCMGPSSGNRFHRVPACSDMSRWFHCCRVNAGHWGASETGFYSEMSPAAETGSDTVSGSINIKFYY